LKQIGPLWNGIWGGIRGERRNEGKLTIINELRGGVYYKKGYYN